MDPPPPRAPRAAASVAGAGPPPAVTAAASRAHAPAVPADQMRASGSGRRKVALPPGRSQLDWVRNSRALPRRPQRAIGLAEVKRHRGRGDAWMVVRGVVYDVTPYVEYHPGGVQMLMAGSGRDATKLFEKYHAWVNPQFMLERCALGFFDGREAAAGSESASESESEAEEGGAAGGKAGDRTAGASEA